MNKKILNALLATGLTLSIGCAKQATVRTALTDAMITQTPYTSQMIEYRASKQLNPEQENGFKKFFDYLWETHSYKVDEEDRFSNNTGSSNDYNNKVDTKKITKQTLDTVIKYAMANETLKNPVNIPYSKKISSPNIDFEDKYRMAHSLCENYSDQLPNYFHKIRTEAVIEGAKDFRNTSISSDVTSLMIWSSIYLSGSSSSDGGSGSASTTGPSGTSAGGTTGPHF